MEDHSWASTIMEDIDDFAKTSIVARIDIGLPNLHELEALPYKVRLSRVVSSNCTISVGHRFHVTFIHLKILLQHDIVIHDYSVV